MRSDWDVQALAAIKRQNRDFKVTETKSGLFIQNVTLSQYEKYNKSNRVAKQTHIVSIKTINYMVTF